MGDEVKDTITGFKGTVIARTQWITGCDRLTLQPKMGKDGKLPESNSFDEGVLVLIKAKKRARATTRLGGPRQELYQRATPSK